MKAKRKKMAFIALLFAAALGLLLRPVAVRALFDEGQAVHMDVSAIENSTLIIGTHLIYLYALNEELYQIAQESASASGQDRVYYKSELADGTWFDITDAGSIEDIVDEGEAVSEESLNALFFTHHTKPDGLTYDLRLNFTVCIFDIFDLYDLEYLPELEALKLWYDRMRESGNRSEGANGNLALVKDFFGTNVITEDVELCEENLEALQRYYTELAQNNADASQKEAVMDVMAKTDNARKEIVFGIVDEGLEGLMDEAAGFAAEEGEEEPFEVDAALLDAIGESQAALSESRIEAQANLLDEGVTILSEKEYGLDLELVDEAKASNFAGCDRVVAELTALNHISGELIVSKTLELTLLEELTAKADGKYQAALSAGPSDAYQNALDKNSSHALLRNLMQEDMAEVNRVRGELQFLLQAKANRQEKDDAQNFVQERLAGSEAFFGAILDGDYKDAMVSSVNAYKNWLLELLAKTGSVNSKTDVDALKEKKERLQEQRMAALDAEDFDQAARIEAELEAVWEEIEANENAIANDLLALEEEILKLEGQLADDPGNLALLSQKTDFDQKAVELKNALLEDGNAANIWEQKEGILQALEEKNPSDEGLASIRAGLDRLGAMLDTGSSLALLAFREVYKKLASAVYLNDAAAYEPLILEVEEMIANAQIPRIGEDGMTQDAALSVVAEVFGGTDGDGIGNGNEMDSSGTGTGTDSDGSGSGEAGTGSDGAGSGEAGDGAGSSGAGSGEAGTGSDGAGSGEAGTGSDGIGNGEAGAGSGEAGAETGSGEAGTGSGGAGSGEAGTGSGGAENGEAGAGSGEAGAGTGSDGAENGEAGAVTGSGAGAEETPKATSLMAEGFSNEERMAAALSLGRYGEETGNEEILALAGGLAGRLAEEDGLAVFLTHSSGGEAFAPADLLASFTGYRYLWNQTKKQALLSRGRHFYRFQAFYMAVEREDGQKEYMDRETEFGGTVYVPNTYIKENFGCEAMEVSGTGYSVLVNDKVLELADELAGALHEKGGE